MQKLHTLLAWLLLLVLAVHLSAGLITLLTPLFIEQRLFARILLGLACLHGVLALWKTVRHKSLRGLLSYGRLNRVFWLRIGSGLAVLALAFVHRLLWVMDTPFGALLLDFEWPSLLVQLLFCGALSVHLVLNIKPLLMDSGLQTAGRTERLCKVAAGLLLLLAALAAVAYFLGVSL